MSCIQRGVFEKERGYHGSAGGTGERRWVRIGSGETERYQSLDVWYGMFLLPFLGFLIRIKNVAH